MKTLKYIVFFILLAFILVFSISYIVWLGYPKTYLNIYILNKTVPNFSYEKHQSLFWILNNSRIVKNNGKHYKKGSDYFGFHPLRPLSDYQYEIKRISLEQIDSIAEIYDAAYYVDTRGVYFNEWFKGFRKRGENSVIEGGVNQNDYLLLKALKNKNKLIIGENNILGTPTSDLLSFKTELLFGVHFTGWVGRYFSSLDSTNTEIPIQVIDKYCSLNNTKWNFKGDGIILYNQSNVIVLENHKHLNAPYPYLVTSDSFAHQMHVVTPIEFLNWFEVVTSNDSVKSITVAEFQINLTSKGDSILSANGLTSIFPAIMVDNPAHIRTIYFAGDFATNKISGIFAQMANSRHWLKPLTTNKQKRFFQYYYFPLIENLLKNYTKEMKN